MGQQIEEFAVVNTSLNILRFYQLWPRKGQSSDQDKFYHCRFILVYALCIPTWLTILLHLTVVLKDNIDSDICEDLSMLSAILGIHIVLTTFVCNQKKLARLYKNLSNFQEFGKPDNFDEKNRKYNRFAVLYTCYCLTGLVIYTAVAFIDESACEKTNLEKNLNEICGLAVKIWVPFDASYFPLKQMFLLNQMYTFLVLSNGAAIIIFSIFEVAQHIMLKVKHLNKLLKKVFNNPDRKISEQNLIHCIKYHFYIIKLYESYNDCYKYCNGCIVFLAGIIFASLANQFVKQTSFPALIHLGGWLVGVFISCYSGQSIFSGSVTVASAAFESKWCETSIKLRKNLILMMARAQQPFCLKAAPVGFMSITLFVNLVKTAYSYFAVLNQTT